MLRATRRIDGYMLTGELARTSTALLYTAGGGVFGDSEGVMKLTGSGYATILRRELSLLNECAAHQVRSVIRPVDSELIWLGADSRLADQPVAAIGLPFLSGGDLSVLVARASVAGRVGAELGLALAEPLANALRDLLEVLPRPVAHGDLRPQNLLLPAPDASVSQLTLIDLDAAAEVAHTPRAPVGDVHAFGELLQLAATGRMPHAQRSTPPSSGNAAFDRLVRRCLASGTAAGEGYASVADPAFVADLSAARAAQPDTSGGALPAGRQPRRWLRGWLSAVMRRGG